MTAYVVGHVKVTNPDPYRGYERGFFPTLKDYEGRLLAADDATETAEGTFPEGRTVILAFPTMEQAKGWYYSSAYQEIIPLRQENSEGTLAFVAGFELPAR